MARISLRRRDGSVRAHALVDDEDFDWLNQWRWSLSNGYVERKVGPASRQRSIKLHRLILGLDFGDPRHGEHENRDPLDNRRANLRIAERAAADNLQNLSMRGDNTSGFRGVCWDRARRRWMAYATVGGVRHNLGRFATADRAAAVTAAFRASHMPFSEDARLAA